MKGERERMREREREFEMKKRESKSLYSLKLKFVFKRWIGKPNTHFAKAVNSKLSVHFKLNWKW